MRKRDPKTERLRRMPLFAGCRKDELALVASRVTEHNVAAGEVLTQEGQRAAEFIVIAEGAAEVLIGGRPVAQLGRGDVVGEIGMLDGGPRTATVVARTELVVNVSSRSEFADLVAGAPTVVQNLLVGLARRLRDTDVRFAAGACEGAA